MWDGTGPGPCARAPAAPPRARDPGTDPTFTPRAVTPHSGRESSPRSLTRSLYTRTWGRSPPHTHARTHATLASPPPFTLGTHLQRRTPTDFTYSDSINLQNCHPAGDTADTTFTHSAAHVPIHVFTQTHTCESPDPKRQDVFSHTNSAQALPVHTQADIICSRTCWPVFFTFSPALTTAPYSGH